MPRGAKLVNPFATPEIATGVVYPAGVALLVVLTGITVVAALPNVWPASPTPAPMTSGGKFASRVPGLPTPAPAMVAEASAPTLLPILTRPAPLAVLFTAAMPEAWTGGAAAALVAAVRTGKSAFKTRGSPTAAPGPAAPPQFVALTTPTTAKPDVGLVSTVLSPFRSIWTTTASAGEALMAPLLPQ